MNRTEKEISLDLVSRYTKAFYQKPFLRNLFLELTLQCNERCFHCGSSCTGEKQEQLSVEEYKIILDQVKEDFDISHVFLCITGGEPLLRKDFFEILGYANQLGYHWGMTTNGTLITRDIAHKLAESGMRTVSVSIDGLQETHDRLRGLPGGYERAMQGIRNLIDEGAFQTIQVTTVVNHQNISELDELFEIMDGIDIDSWRVINLEPIGRALQYPEMMCTKEDYIRLFDFIREKRTAGYPVEYGCSHFLGLEYEREIRNWYWFCGAGLTTASIMANGDIGACLDIERRPETIQGNIRKDRFSDVWKNRFKIFRKDLTENSEYCKDCDYRSFCRGDAHHTWDYDRNQPRVCLNKM
ncbi:MAG: radical SAM protein [Oscillospiraceae bacterium]|nr:radical SAM protein [Oscillospiraceae bacterium]